jgi:Glycosyl transferases group 1
MTAISKGNGSNSQGHPERRHGMNRRLSFLISIVAFLSLRRFYNNQEVMENIMDEESDGVVEKDMEVEASLYSVPLTWQEYPVAKSTEYRARSKEEMEELLKGYLPSMDPVLPLHDFKPSSKRPVQIHFWTGSTDAATTKFLLEGIERSHYLKLIHVSLLKPQGVLGEARVHTDRDDLVPCIWMLDLVGIEHDCHSIKRLILYLLDLTKKKRLNTRLLWVDYSGSWQTLQCPNIVKLISRAKSIHIRIAQRSIVRGRLWDSDQNWVQMGTLLPNPGRQGPYLTKGNLLHSPYPVREAVVTEVMRLLEIQRRDRHLRKLRPVDANRPNDVVFFGNKEDPAHYGNLRCQVSETVQSLQEVKIAGHSIRTLVRFFGEPDLMTGSTSVVYGRYIQEMLQTKVIVIAQRDEWEDHYRLMESLASGALVFSDRMIAQPRGLVHLKNIVFYDDTASLRRLLLYFLDPKNEKERLSVAKKGWEVVMGHHRSWHRVEEIIFGSPKTAVDKAYDTPPSRRKRDKLKDKGKQSIPWIDIPEEKVILDDAGTKTGDSNDARGNDER